MTQYNKKVYNISPKKEKMSKNGELLTKLIFQKGKGGNEANRNKKVYNKNTKSR